MCANSDERRTHSGPRLLWEKIAKDGLKPVTLYSIEQLNKDHWFLVLWDCNNEMFSTRGQFFFWFRLSSCFLMLLITWCFYRLIYVSILYLLHRSPVCLSVCLSLSVSLIFKHYLSYSLFFVTLLSKLNSHHLRYIPTPKRYNF